MSHVIRVTNARGDFELLTPYWLDSSARRRIPKLPGTYQWREVAFRWKGGKFGGSNEPIYAWVPGNVSDEDLPDVRSLPDIETFYGPGFYQDGDLGSTDDM